VIRREFIEDGDLHVRYTPECDDDVWIIGLTKILTDVESDISARMQFGDLIVTKRLG
jgi:hypothetical protein